MVKNFLAVYTRCYLGQLKLYGLTFTSPKCIGFGGNAQMINDSCALYARKHAKLLNCMALDNAVKKALVLIRFFSSAFCVEASEATVQIFA